MSVDVSQLMIDLIRRILTDPAAAFQFASDGPGTLAAQGITEGDLSGLDMPDLVDQACQSDGVPAETRSALQGYTSGSPSYGSGPVSPPPSGYTSGPHSIDQVMQNLNYVTYVAYEGDDYIQQTIIDQSTDVNVGDDFTGDIDVHNAAADDGGIAGSGYGDVTGTTGDYSQTVDDSLIGQNQMNSPGGVQVGDDLNAPVNTGVNTGIMADGDVEDSVVGDGNQTVNADGPVDDSVFNFGGGDVSQITDSDVHDSALSVGSGHASNSSDNYAETGGAVANEGDASGYYSDDDTTSETFETSNVETGDYSQVSTELGEGDQHSDQDLEQDVPDVTFQK